jgi:very-short-patch-repair endonuclease
MLQGNPDRQIHQLAARQHGVVTRDQLLRAGVSEGSIDHRLKKRTLRSVHRGVYCTGPVTARHQREMAGVLACGPNAVLSDQTAGIIWGMLPSRQPEAPVDLTVPRTLRGPSSGVRLHRRGALAADEVTRRHGLPLTTPFRTIFDLASSLGPSDLERILDRALRRDLVALESVEAMLLRHPRRRGCLVLRALLDDAAEPALTRSEAEVRFLALLRKGGVPRPRTNAVVTGLEVDFFWPGRSLVVEVDGFAFHAHRDAFENDRRRDRILAGEGLTVIRVTWRQLQNEPEKVLARLCMALGARSGRAGEREPVPVSAVPPNGTPPP